MTLLLVFLVAFANAADPVPTTESSAAGVTGATGAAGECCTAESAVNCCMALQPVPKTDPPTDGGVCVGVAPAGATLKDPASLETPCEGLCFAAEGASACNVITAAGAEAGAPAAPAGATTAAAAGAAAATTEAAAVPVASRFQAVSAFRHGQKV